MLKNELTGTQLEDTLNSVSDTHTQTTQREINEIKRLTALKVDATHCLKKFRALELLNRERNAAKRALERHAEYDISSVVQAAFLDTPIKETRDGKEFIRRFQTIEEQFSGEFAELLKTYNTAQKTLAVARADYRAYVQSLIDLRENERAAATKSNRINYGNIDVYLLRNECEFEGAYSDIATRKTYIAPCQYIARSNSYNNLRLMHEHVTGVFSQVTPIETITDTEYLHTNHTQVWDSVASDTARRITAYYVFSFTCSPLNRPLVYAQNVRKYERSAAVLLEDTHKKLCEFAGSRTVATHSISSGKTYVSTNEKYTGTGRGRKSVGQRGFKTSRESSAPTEYPADTLSHNALFSQCISELASTSLQLRADTHKAEMKEINSASALLERATRGMDALTRKNVYRAIQSLVNEQVLAQSELNEAHAQSSEFLKKAAQAQRARERAAAHRARKKLAL